MLDAFKSIGGKGKDAQKQNDELQLLIANAREERGAMSAMLNSLTSRTAKLTPLTKQLEQVTDKATAVTEKLDEIAKRVATLDSRTRELEAIDKRIESLQAAATQAELTTQKAIGPDGELQKHREAVQQLSSQALQTQAALDTLKKERTALEDLRGHLREAEGEVKAALGQAGSLKGDLEQVRSTASSLQQDYTKLRETSREAREDANAAVSTVKDVEKKLGAVTQLHELSRTTDERLTALNALAEHVSRKTKVLESQQQSVEHAIVQANRVNEMVWSMDVQIGKLNEGMKQIAKAEEAIGRVERLSHESSTQLAAAEKTRQEADRETAKLTKEAAALLDTTRGQVDALALGKKEFEALDERVRSLQGAVGDAESRMDALTVKDKTLAAMSQKIDAITKQFETLSAQADELARKQQSLETLHEQIGQVDQAAKQATWQMDALRQSRADLDLLRKEIQDFYKSHGEIEKLRDKLGADRQAIEAFGERLNAMAARAPELDAKMTAILGHLKLVDEGTQKATGLSQTTAELDAQVSRVLARLPFVEKLEARLDGLNALSADVDQRLKEQLARRNELDTLKVSCDGLAAQLVDVQHKLEGVRQLETRLVPLVAELNALKKAIGLAGERIDTVKYDEAAIAEHEKRFADVVAASRGVATEVAERVRQMQSLSEELARTTGLKNELVADLDRVQSR